MLTVQFNSYFETVHSAPESDLHFQKEKLTAEGGRSPGMPHEHAKKLRYMSKIAAIFGKGDKTPLICTQPIANLPMVRW
jgi:hypothetical protein